MSQMGIVYEQTNGWSDWLFPLMRGYRQGCCGCGLACDKEFRVLYNGKILSARKYRVIYRCRCSLLSAGNLTIGSDEWSKWHTFRNAHIFLEKCADCPFVHDMEFRVVRVLTDDHRNGFTYRMLRSKKFTIQMRTRRNKRSTGQLRRCRA
jgi:hypothetical protein